MIDWSVSLVPMIDWFADDHDLLAAAGHLLLHEAPQVVHHQEQEDRLHSQVINNPSLSDYKFFFKGQSEK